MGVSCIYVYVWVWVCHVFMCVMYLCVCVCSFQSTFFRQHGCTTNDANAKYNSRAAQLYREKLTTMAATAHRAHGTEVCVQGVFSCVQDVCVRVQGVRMCECVQGVCN